MGLHDLADVFRRFGVSPGYAALSTVASLLIIPIALVAIWRWAMSWWRARQRQQAIKRLGEYVIELRIRVPVHGGMDVEEAGRIAADLISNAGRVDISLAIGLRDEASLPARNKITPTLMAASISGLGDGPVAAAYRVGRLRDYLKIMIDEGHVR